MVDEVLGAVRYHRLVLDNVIFGGKVRLGKFCKAAPVGGFHRGDGDVRVENFELLNVVGEFGEVGGGGRLEELRSGEAVTGVL